jgi:HemY protein
LKEAAETSNAQEIQELWESIPKYVQAMPGILAIYFAAMINSGAGAKIEKDLVRALNDKWDMTLFSSRFSSAPRECAARAAVK